MVDKETIHFPLFLVCHFLVQDPKMVQHFLDIISSTATLCICCHLLIYRCDSALGLFNPVITDIHAGLNLFILFFIIGFKDIQIIEPVSKPPKLQFIISQLFSLPVQLVLKLFFRTLVL